MNKQFEVVSLHSLAHARTGDKGNRLNVSLICYRPEMYPVLAEQVSEAVVAELFSLRAPASVRRYDLPNLGAFNFVIDEVLGGGVNNSLFLDKHGKGLSFLLLSLEIRVPIEIIVPGPCRSGNA
jgi:hypothetical protein